MGRTIKRLSSLEIDEVSLVDRPANQHGLVAIAKNYQEDNMGVYDAAGDEVFEEELQHGDCVYDDAGNEFIFVEDEVDEYEEELVGKAAWETSYDAARKAGTNTLKGRRAKLRAGAQREHSGEGNWGKVRRALGSDRATAASGRAHRAADSAFATKTSSRIDRARGHALGQYGAHPASHVAAGGVAAVGGEETVRRNWNGGKSLGDEVMESLSKALTDTDRSEVIANAMDYMDDVAKRNENLEDIVAQILEDRETEGFVQLAKGYELPANPEDIAGIMYRASQTMPEGDVALLDRMFSSMSDVNKASYEELGYSGGYESDSLSQIYAAAGEVVSKSGAAMTQEQAVTALFGANSAAYDEYEAEQRYNR